ncbi:MAG: homocysteine S-methyltransferase family protein [Flavobacteriales bacterium]|nr:homocysteine S-methyltransferase family protein [Flavobacteriales bacterium]
MKKDDLRSIAASRILILDGAMGTMIQRYNLTEDDFRNDSLKDHHASLKGNNDLLALTRPDILEAIHDAYFEAGADIVETNTFSSTSIAQDDYDLPHLVYDLNYESARIASDVANRCTEKNPDKPRYVAGSIGPTNKTASLSPDVNDPAYRAVTYDELVAAYKEQMIALIDGGVDAFLIETIFDTLNAKAALFAAEEAMAEKGVTVPIMVSGTITDASGRTLSGQTAEAFLISMSHVPLLSVGFNCALGAAQLTPYIDVVSRNTEALVSAHPNAGLPNEMGAYDQTPEQMANEISEYLDRGIINIVGGCCGTTPDHIRAIAEMAATYEPRKIKVEA